MLDNQLSEVSSSVMNQQMLNKLNAFLEDHEEYGYGVAPIMPSMLTSIPYKRRYEFFKRIRFNEMLGENTDQLFMKVLDEIGIKK